MRMHSILALVLLPAPAWAANAQDDLPGCWFGHAVLEEQSTPVAQPGYLSPMTPGLVVLDPVTGHELAREELPLAPRGHSGIVARPLVVGDRIFAAQVDGTLRTYRLER